MKRSLFKIILRMLQIVDKFVFVLFAAILNGTIGNLCAIGITVLSSLALATFFGLNIGISLTWLVVIIIALGVLRGILRYLEQYLNHYIAFKILAIIRHKVFCSLKRLSISDVEEKEKGNMISMISGDVETLEVFYAHTMSPVCIAILVSATILTLMCIFISPYLMLVTFGFYLLIGFLMPAISFYFIKRNGGQYRQKLGKFNNFFMDSIKGIDETKLYGDELTRSDVINRGSALLEKMKTKNNNLTTLFKSICESIILISALVFLGLAYYLYTKNLLEIYQIIIGVTMLLSSFGPLLALSALPTTLVDTFASGNRILDLLDQQPSINFIIDGVDLSDFDYIRIKDLSYSYEAKKEILKNINLNIKKNEIVVIQGESGIGKSTLLKLMMRYYNVPDECIKINDVSINKINTSSLFDIVTMFSQSTYLFNDTIRNNLLIAKPNATEEEILSALKKASIFEFVVGLENGLDTVINNNNTNISLGEKQRLGLARVILKNPKLLLLDEPTSNIDAQNEKAFLKALQEMKQDMSIVIVTHKAQTASIADRLLTISGGKLEARKA